VSFPTWEGTRTNTRIAYFSHSQLRVVAGDGTGDRLLDAHAQVVPVAWSPTRLHTLAYVVGGSIVLRNTAAARSTWRHELTLEPSQLTWSSDGALLAVVTRHRVIVLDAAGHVHRVISSLDDAIASVAFRPRTHELAVSLRPALSMHRSEVRLVDVDRPGRSRLLFAGPGVFRDLAWSPGGAWLLIDWPTANQWLFVTPGARPRVRAVANIDEQFPRPDRLGPLLELAGGWCCTAPG
jgi:Tol biopolymer transport system component